MAAAPWEKEGPETMLREEETMAEKDWKEGEVMEEATAEPE